MLRKSVRSPASVGLAALLLSLAAASPALAQGYLGPNLRPFAVLAGTTVTCAGASTITGDVGVSPGSAIVGFPAPCTDVGTLRTPPASDPAQLNLTAAYTTLAGLPCGATVGPILTGLTLTPGVYCVGAAASNLTGTLTLDALGNPNAVFVFKMSSTLITSPGSTVLLTNGANACSVQWQVSDSATLDVGTTFVGNILALTSIGMNSGASLTGRALARNGAVTLNANNVSFGACGAGGGPIGPPPPFCPTITIAPPTLPNGAVGAAYTQTLTASGGTAPYTFSVVSGTLPAGLTLTAGGVLSGTPTTAGSSAVTIRATDANGCFAQITYAIAIVPNVPTLPQAFVILLALGLAGVGYFRLRRGARAE